jgi:naphthalene 1,2-dioxygenase ferredoxin reductase component
MSSFTVHVAQFDRPIVVQTGQTILDAALEQGFDYPHGCCAGNCTACKSSLVEGEVDLLPYSEFALSDDERAAGTILACRAVPWSDCRVAYLEDAEIA